MAIKMLIDLSQTIYDSSNIKLLKLITLSSDKDYKILFLFDPQLKNYYKHQS